MRQDCQDPSVRISKPRSSRLCKAVVLKFPSSHELLNCVEPVRATDIPIRLKDSNMRNESYHSVMVVLCSNPALWRLSVDSVLGGRIVVISSIIIQRGGQNLPETRPDMRRFTTLDDHERYRLKAGLRFGKNLNSGLGLVHVVTITPTRSDKVLTIFSVFGFRQASISLSQLYRALLTISQMHSRCPFLKKIQTAPSIQLYLR